MRLKTKPRSRRARLGTCDQAAAVVMLVAYHVIYMLNRQECELTGGREGKHSEQSSHYRNEAWDFKANHIASKELCEAIAKDMQARLGPDFYVEYEHKDGAAERHFHVQWKPRWS